MVEPKVIVISGGSRGLGQGIISGLIEDGHTVATFSRQSSPFVEDTMKRFPDRFLWEAVDGTDHSRLEGFIQQANSRFGKIDALINNAGIAIDGVLTLTARKDISRTIAVNLESTIVLSQICTKFLLRRKDGSIINISSIIGIRGYSGLAAYSATKAGMDGLTRALARELGGRNIRVNSIAPGYLETEMSSKLNPAQRDQIIRRTPLGRLGRVEDVVGPVRFLLSPDARFITGQTIVIDGGITC